MCAKRLPWPWRSSADANGSAFGAFARRHARLPQQEAVRQAVARALVDPVRDEREAASLAAQAIDLALGTSATRPEQAG